MELVEVCTKSRCHTSPSCRPTTSPYIPPKQVEQCTRRYVQPPRMPSYAPKKLYRPPSKPFNGSTTYHGSYLNTPPHYIRTKSIRPTPVLQTVEGKFQDDTTNRLSYKPIWDPVKAQPIIPIRRKLMMDGPMQNSTTVREDFGPKYVERPAIVMPAGNIRLCSGPMEDRTTSAISFVNPGFIRPPVSCKPSNKYSPNDDPLASETTHMLSYQPYRVEQREVYPWAQKPPYKPPVTSMDSRTTYSKSYMEIGTPTKAKPIIPMSGGEWFQENREFNGKTCYSDAYIPRAIQSKCMPIKPRVNIGLSDKKMTGDTTNKLSFQSVRGEKRTPFRPRRRNMMNSGSMQSMTTHRSDYQFKTTQKSEIVIPCDNIRHSNKPLEGYTTSALSYMDHGFVPPPPSFKPSVNYNRSSSKLEADTVNKLSYQPWSLPPKEIFPWAKKGGYQRPKEPMVGDSIYNMSFAPPGYYIEECETLNCTDANDNDNSNIPNVCTNNDCCL